MKILTPLPTLNAKNVGLVALGLTAAFLIGQGVTLFNPYALNDDGRQQTYWMQQWLDPELYQNDLLTEYAKFYVPWGVKAVNYIAAQVVNPLLFSKLLTLILFVVAGSFVFALALQLGDELTAYFAVCFFTLFGSFMMKISGGLSQSFVYPMLLAYLYFISRDRIAAAGVTIGLQGVFNPYLFVLCAATQILYLAHTRQKEIFSVVMWVWGVFRKPQQVIANPARSRRTVAASRYRRKEPVKAQPMAPVPFMLCQIPILLGFFAVLLKHLFLYNPKIGSLVTAAQMAGLPEYGPHGRYWLYPVPSFFREIILEPWIFNAGFENTGLVASWLFVIALILMVALAIRNREAAPDFDYYKGFRVFLYLAPASLVLYIAARMVLLKLFIPSRYLEYSINVFYCLVAAICLRIVVESCGLKKHGRVIVAALLLIGGIRLYGLSVFDYSQYADLYKFLHTTPKSALTAGHPELMDNTLTFGRRKALVTYELSHTWIQPYWDEIRQRTFDLFKAYYSNNPEDVREFSRKYNIDYLVVRESDFYAPKLRKPKYFPPFDDYIKDIAKPCGSFAVLDSREFPPIYCKDGIRVLKMTNSDSPPQK